MHIIIKFSLYKKNIKENKINIKNIKVKKKKYIKNIKRHL